MAADAVQANYPSLETIATNFGKAAETNTELHGKLMRAVRALQDGGWQGEGSRAFFSEMEGAIFPALQRLIQALEQAGATTLKVKEVLRQSEEEAATLFKSDGVGNGVAPQPTATAGVSAFSAAGSAPTISGATTAGGGGAGSQGSAATSARGAGSDTADVQGTTAPASGSGGQGSSAPPSGGSGSSSAAPLSAFAASTATPAPQPTATPPRQTDSSKEMLGSLSEKYESSGTGVGTVSGGVGDPGGVSYGKYQLSSKTGTAAEFLRNDGAKWKGEFGNAKPGSAAFSDKWRAIAKRDPEGFARAQYEFIKSSHYDPEATQIQQATGLDLSKRSQALREVVWSTSVQHRNAASTIVSRALKGKDVSAMSDADIINAVYAERSKPGANGRLAYFQKTTSPSWQRGLRKRFRNERADAIAMLEREKR